MQFYVDLAVFIVCTSLLARTLFMYRLFDDHTNVLCLITKQTRKLSWC